MRVQTEYTMQTTNSHGTWPLGLCAMVFIRQIDACKNVCFVYCAFQMAIEWRGIAIIAHRLRAFGSLLHKNINDRKVSNLIQIRTQTQTQHNFHATMFDVESRRSHESVDKMSMGCWCSVDPSKIERRSNEAIPSQNACVRRFLIYFFVNKISRHLVASPTPITHSSHRL